MARVTAPVLYRNRFRKSGLDFLAGPSYVVFWVWHVLLQILSFVALLWFGIYFPERWRLDICWPWLKWLILAAGAYGTVMEGWVSAARQFDARRTAALMGLEWNSGPTGS